MFTKTWTDSVSIVRYITVFPSGLTEESVNTVLLYRFRFHEIRCKITTAEQRIRTDVFTFETNSLFSWLKIEEGRNLALYICLALVDLPLVTS